MQLPIELLRLLDGVKGFEKEAFVNVHDSGKQITSIRINPFKLSGSPKVLPFGEDLGGASLSTICFLCRRNSVTYDSADSNGLVDTRTFLRSAHIYFPVLGSEPGLFSSRNGCNWRTVPPDSAFNGCGVGFF